MNTTPDSLQTLFSDHWDAYMRAEPFFATMCGDHRFDNQLGQADEAHYADWLSQLEGFQRRLTDIDPQPLSEDDRLNYEYFERMLEAEIGRTRILSPAHPFLHHARSDA